MSEPGEIRRWRSENRNVDIEVSVRNIMGDDNFRECRGEAIRKIG